jgi:hypothetical protein
MNEIFAEFKHSLILVNSVLTLLHLNRVSDELDKIHQVISKRDI